MSTQDRLEACSHDSSEPIQELLRHANPRITMEVYVKGDADMKRAALGTSMSGLFVVPAEAAETA
jgi:integrase